MNDQKRVLIFGMGRMGKAISWCMSKFGNHIISVDKDIDTQQLRKALQKDYVRGNAARFAVF